MIESGNVTEVFKYEKDKRIYRRKRKKDTYYRRMRDPEPRREDNIRRARQSFKRLVRSNLDGIEAPALFTFTMYQVVPIGASCVAFSECVNRLRRAIGSRFRYIAVPEFQKRGAVHWHVLIWGLPSDWACRGSWSKIGRYWRFKHECEAGRQCERRTRRISRLWGLGFVDGIVTDGSLKLAGYLAKYMSKAMHDTRLGRKRAYNTSRNSLRPVSFTVEKGAAIGFLPSYLMDGDNFLRERQYTTEWQGRVIYQIYERNIYENRKSEGDGSESRLEGGGVSEVE